MHTLGQQIRIRRVELNMSQGELCKRAKISRAALWAIEQDRGKELRLATLDRIAKALKMELRIDLEERE